MIVFSLFLFKMMFRRENTNLFFLLMIGMILEPYLVAYHHLCKWSWIQMSS